MGSDNNKETKEASAKGEAIARFFNLKPVHGEYIEPRYRTAWGTKTSQGVYRSVFRLIESRIKDLEKIV